jgi:predicted transcriptional regulator
MTPATDLNTSIPADDPAKDRMSVVHVAGKIVAAYVSKNEVSKAELPDLITSTIDAIEGRIRSHSEGSAAKSVVDTSKTIFPDHIISLEDGRAYKTLKRHLRKYGMSPDEYRRKWNLPSDYPMVSENYSKARSKLAKDTGLGSVRHLKAA